VRSLCWVRFELPLAFLARHVTLPFSLNSRHLRPDYGTCGSSSPPFHEFVRVFPSPNMFLMSALGVFNLCISPVSAGQFESDSCFLLRFLANHVLAFFSGPRLKKTAWPHCIQCCFPHSHPHRPLFQVWDLFPQFSTALTFLSRAINFHGSFLSPNKLTSGQGVRLDPFAGKPLDLPCYLQSFF